MTDHSHALAELVHEHDMLREMMDECEQLADEIDAGRGDLGTLVGKVARLRAALESHNRVEERVLRPIRIEHMFDDHVEEHRALNQRLDGPTAMLRATLFDLRAHIAREDRYFLSASMRVS